MVTDDVPNHLHDWETWRVALGVVLITFGAVGAAGGGIGGGGLYVPLLLMVIGLDAKEAVPISQACILGAATAHFILNVPKKHPLFNKPVVDYAALLTLEPMLLAGAIFGVLANDILPSPIILTILMVVLAAGTIRTGMRARRVTRNERERAEKRAKEVAAGGAVQASVKPPEPLAEIPWNKLGWVLMLWLIVSVFVVVRGSTAGDKSIVGVQYCSPAWWILCLAIPVVTGAFSVFLGGKEISGQKEAEEEGSSDDEAAEKLKNKENAAMSDYKEVVWTWKGVFAYMAIAFTTGLLAGCLGIGGGLVLSPLLLELGFYPAVASAISGMAVLVTSSSALLLYALSGKVYWEFALLMMPLTFVSTYIGKVKIDAYAEKHQKQSVIIWSVAIFIFICFILLSAEGIGDLVDDPSFAFSDLCEAD